MNLHMPALHTLILNIGSTSIILHEHRGTYKSGGISYQMVSVGRLAFYVSIDSVLQLILGFETKLN